MKAMRQAAVGGTMRGPQRALYKQMVTAKGPKEAEEMLRRGLAKVLDH